MTPDTPRVYLTLRCNMACPYCSNGRQIATFHELTAAEWNQRIRCFRGAEVAFTGGEPTLHPEFYELVTMLSRDYAVNVYSNFKEPLDLSRLPNQPACLHFRASCHAQTAEEAEEWIANVERCHNAGYRMTCTTVLPPKPVVEALRGRHVIVDAPQVKPTALAPPVRCTLPRYLIAPDGRRFHCVGKLVRADPSGVVPYSDGHTIICRTPNRCAKCDSLASQRSLAE